MAADAARCDRECRDDQARLLFYCQHASGSATSSARWRSPRGSPAPSTSSLLNGGRMPEGTGCLPGCASWTCRRSGYDDAFQLVSHDPRLAVARAQEERRRTILDVLDAVRPQVLLVELFPFGRNKFAFELLPLLEAARAAALGGPLVLCSLRDILVSRRATRPRHDERACRAGQRVVRRGARARRPARSPGWRRRSGRRRRSASPSTTRASSPRPPRSRRTGHRCPVLVSAGGGMVGEPLFRAAVDAHARAGERLGLTHHPRRRSVPARAGLAVAAARGGRARRG